MLATRIVEYLGIVYVLNIAPYYRLPTNLLLFQTFCQFDA